MLVLGVLLLVISWALVRASQVAFQDKLLDSQSNHTALCLSSLSKDYTVLKHPHFQLHSIRIRKTPSEFCDPSVASYTGYIDTSSARHIFFYFFESRDSPDTDPVILWTNGGPGCSSAMGLFMELGPCRIDLDSEAGNGNGTKVNPYSWNEKANIFFVDQPVGTSLSLTSHFPTIF